MTKTIEQREAELATANAVLKNYNVKIRAIYAELAQISTLTQSMAIAGTAKAGNPRFDSLMARQDQLIQSATTLTDSLLPHQNG
ncbi:hypothetical protein [Pandoraea communis]|uniref:hypothetical protein n=1 Tax=Pandoraea communis TaxID=2508297 RepID=UPI0025A68C96|nr:hypothetical protein [Pandoraea communis]MDM8356567.1 hypothetical protein [Pandoraea communis]